MNNSKKKTGERNINSKCSKCGAGGFHSSWNLKRHENKCTKTLDQVKSSISKNSQRNQDKFICSKCYSSFSLKGNLRKHLNKCEKIESQKSFPCIDSCDFNAVSKKALLHHIEVDHGVSKEIKEFSSHSEFIVWKHSIEKQTVTKYVNQHGSSRIKSPDFLSRQTFVCHRDGYFKSRSTGKRRVKMIGSNKIDGHCPSKMILTVKGSGSCFVEYYPFHIGHQFEIGRLSLTKEVRESFAAKLSQKISLDEILNEIRDSIANNEVDRVHLLQKKDLNNIIRDFKLNSKEVVHKNDATSVEAWVDSMKNSPNNIIRYYKPQGELSAEQPFLNMEDFVLIFYNEAQLDMLKEYGNDVICIDGTHGINTTSFDLYTVLILDDMREVFPCAFMVSNRGDTLTLKLFFEILKSSIGGPLKPITFMSDMAEQFFLAWSAVMANSGKTTRLFCSWHVDQAWRNNLKKISSLEKQMSVYKSLKDLTYQTSKTHFKIMSENFLRDLYSDIDCTDFAAYIEDFITSPSTWAYSYRTGAGINTNNRLETFHNTLKYIYLQGKTVKRLDKGLHAVMKFVRNKLFDRLITMTKGKLTKKLSSLRDRHVASLKSNFSGHEVEDGWVISSPGGANHKVTKDLETNDCNCYLRCSDCFNECIHSYTCTCIDFLVKWNMCVHIHFTITHFQNTQIIEIEDLYYEESNIDDIPVVISAHSVPNEVPLETRKKEFIETFKKLVDDISTDDQLDACIKLTAPMSSLIKANSLDSSQRRADNEDLKDFEPFESYIFI